MRKKNALREHFLGAYDPQNPDTEPTTWFNLDHWITNISDDTDEATDSYGDYAGDGNATESITGVSERWTFEGTFDPEDPTHQFVKSLKRAAPGEDPNLKRMVWHKIEETDGSVIIGVARITALIAGGGDATEYEAFSGTINFINTPTVTPATPATPATPVV